MLRRYLIALALVGAAATPAAAQDAVWSGRLVCDPVEGFTTQPLNVPFEVTVRRGVATYARPVLSSQAARTGVWERGEGRVAADGAVVMEGGAGGRGFVYRARYEGRFGPEPTAEVTGHQDWVLEARQFRRDCRATLTRQGG